MEKLTLLDLKNKRFHFIGIGGISMSALSQMLLSEGVYVQGSDEGKSEEIERLKAMDIKVFSKHQKQNLENIDVVVYSSAISEENEELLEAKQRGFILLKRAQLLGLIAEDYEVVISVAGSHGKTTTAAMISQMFIEAGLDPTIHLGGVLKSINSNMRIGKKDFFITESCEYKNNFLYLKPDLSVVLNIDADHLDFFGDLQGVKSSFLSFSKNTKSGGLNILCGDDVNSSELTKSAKSLTFGLNNANFTAKNIKICKNSEFSFDVICSDFCFGNITLNMLGKHNVYNALAAVVVGILCGIDFCDIKKSIEGFSGTKRRTDFVGEVEGVKIYQDYAHHPKQIREMILVGKQLLKNNGKFIVVFEPHTYSRTKFLIDDFVIALSGADSVVLSPVYSARENESQGFSSDELYMRLKQKSGNVCLIEDYKQIKDYILNIAKSDDVVFILGAGSIENLSKLFLKDDA